MTLPRLHLKKQDGEVKEALKSPIEPDKTLKKKSFLKALHKKALKKPEKKSTRRRGQSS